MNVKFYIFAILLMSCLASSSAKEVSSVSYMHFTDSANEVEEYAYDANGNMTRDLNKGIANINYNLLNLPGEITFSDGRKVKYIYTADGAKVRTTYFDATGSQTLQVDYCGNYILRNGVVDRILTTSGYIKNDTVFSYVKDYQGNVRSIVRQDGVVVESTDYYPYGTPFTTAGAVQPYKYGTKELDRMHGLDLYDSQARWYDSLLGRTSTMDPKAEKYYNLSPYTWCAGNPVKFVDPNGCEPTIDEAAAIAAHVYGDRPNEILIGGWQVSQLILNLNYNNPASGFKSNLYERVVDGVVTEYVYATAGTEDGRDWIANVTQLTGLSYQYLKSGENAKAISAALSNMELNFVGHSLGGGEAALNSILTSSKSLIGRKAFTFNAAGVSNATKFLVGGMSALINLRMRL